MKCFNPHAILPGCFMGVYSVPVGEWVRHQVSKHIMMNFWFTPLAEFPGGSCHVEAYLIHRTTESHVHTLHSGERDGIKSCFVSWVFGRRWMVYSNSSFTFMNDRYTRFTSYSDGLWSPRKIGRGLNEPVIPVTAVIILPISISPDLWELYRFFSIY